jgi:hypothetical protein
LFFFKKGEKSVASNKRAFSPFGNKIDAQCEMVKINRVGEAALNKYVSLLVKQKDWTGLTKLFEKISFSKGKKTILFLGNCQARPISRLVEMNSSFTADYNLIKVFPAIHDMSIELQTYIRDEILPRTNLLITQNVLNDTFPLKTSSCRQVCNTLVFPTCYFDGYFPDAIYLKKGGLTLRQTPITDYHSSYVLHCFIQGLSVEECTQNLISGSWVGQGYPEKVSSIWASLYKREEQWDIKVIDYLHDNYRKRRLFHTLNHPTAEVLCFIANGIFKELGLKPVNFVNVPEFLGESQWLINNRVIRELGLKAENQNCFKLNGKEVAAVKFVDRHYGYYKSAGDVVNENTQTCEKKISYWGS